MIADRVSGTGVIRADHVVIEGTLAPGNSPGCINFEGDVTFNATATLVTEIGGLIPCTEYDQITVSKKLTINDATLEVVLINGFIPAFGDLFDALDWNRLAGNFGIIDISAAALPYYLVPVRPESRVNTLLPPAHIRRIPQVY